MADYRFLDSKSFFYKAKQEVTRFLEKVLEGRELKMLTSKGSAAATPSNEEQLRTGAPGPGYKHGHFVHE